MTQPRVPLLMAPALGPALGLAVSLAVSFAILASSPPASAAKGLVVPKAEPSAAPAAASSPSTAASWNDFNARPLTLPAGMLELHGDFVANISSGNGGKPIWLTPNIGYGATDDLTLVLATNPQAEFLPIGGGLCLGTEQYCGHLFNSISPNVLLSLVRTPGVGIAVHAGVDYNFSPSLVGVRAGALLKVVLPAALSLAADPTVFVAVTKRNTLVDDQILLVPIRLGFQAAELVNVGVVSGVNGPLSSRFSKGYSVPVGVGAWFAATPSLDLGANLTFVDVRAGADGRTVALSANYRL